MSRRVVKVGPLPLGGGKIAVQSMTTEKTSDAEKCVAQVIRLEQAGCDLVRVAVLDEADARAITAVKERVHVPIAADIHFSPALAVLAMEAGADKLRINPGNIGSEAAVARVADCARAHKVPIRVGANTGSIEPQFFAKYGRSAEALVESALLEISMLERRGVEDLVVSVKASDVQTTVKAYTMLASRVPYPLHLGVTEAGVGESALVKSSIGIGSLLLNGIGDTIRVSLSAEPEEEVRAAHEILRACGLEHDYAEVIACPTCGRCEYDCIGLAHRVSAFVKDVKKPCRIAVMGCVVNGPGEARDADLGIAGGRELCMIFEKGKPILRVAREEAESVFFRYLTEFLQK